MNIKKGIMVNIGIKDESIEYIDYVDSNDPMFKKVKGHYTPTGFIWNTEDYAEVQKYHNMLVKLKEDYENKRSELYREVNSLRY